MKSIISFLVACFIFFGCGRDDITSQNSGYGYSIVQKLSCFCPYSNTNIKLFITADTLSNAIILPGNNKLPGSLWGRYKTINELFDLISRIDTSAFKIKVEMDKTNKYPAFLSVSPKPKIINDTIMQNIYDVDYSYTTSNYVRNK